MSPRTRWLVIGSVIGVLVLIAVGVLAWLGANAEPTKSDPNNPRLVARGKIVYAQQCASCHGANLEGQPNWRERLPNGRLPAPPHDATGHTWHHSDNELFGMVKTGIPEIVPGYQTDMPKYEGILSASDTWAVLSFIESTWPPVIRERQQRLNRRSP
jgi:mono/diheme cytochrome c family protein